MSKPSRSIIDAPIHIVRTRFTQFLLLIVGVYAVFQTVYVARLPLVMDEFAGGKEVYRLTGEVPYRDFVPYKTVLGYYIQFPAALLSQSVWGRLMAIKGWMVVLNSALLFAAGLAMRRLLRPAAILIAVLLLAMSSTFLERSSDLRVDMLTAWAGFFALLSLLEGRYVRAGVLTAVSFLISQKGAFFVLAGNAALLVELIAHARRRQILASLLRFNAAAAISLGVYLAVWSMVSTPAQVLQAVFTNAAGAALTDVYAIRARYWTQILLRNPMLFLLAAAALWHLGSRLIRRETSTIETRVLAYAATVLTCMIAYSQPWPYFFVLLFPTLCILHATFLDQQQLRPLTLAIVAAGGVLWPLLRVPTVLARDSSYQQYTVSLAAALTQPHDAYFAGAPILHDRDHAVPELEWIDPMRVAQLKSSEQQITRVLDALSRRPPKTMIGNYRVYLLPPPLWQWFDRRYARLSASVYVYAPHLPPGSSLVWLSFDGRYRLDSRTNAGVIIDGREHGNGDDVHLAKGMHRVDSPAELRLRLLPAGAEGHLRARFTEEQDLYPNVYDY